MADNRQGRQRKRPNAHMSEREKEEYIRKKRRIEKRNEEIRKSKRIKKRIVDDRVIPNDDIRRRVRDVSEYDNLRQVGNNPKAKKRMDINRNIKNKRRKRKKIIKRTILAIVAVIIISIIYTISSVSSLLSSINKGNMIEPTIVSMDQTVNILLLGMDIGDVKNPSNESNKRTDTIMVLNYNPKTNKIHLVSIPRDTMIDINGRTWKINAAYPIGGDERIKTEVEKLLSINVNYIVQVDYSAFRELIDAIGGVDMEIKYDMHYTDRSQNLKIDFNKGTTEHLDGDKAEKFFRWRKNDDGTGLPNGDLDRIKNQHDFLEQVVKKCTKPSTIFKIPKILKAVGNNVHTNMPGSKVLEYAFKMIKLNSSDIIMTTLKGTPKMINGQSYVVCSKDANKDLIKALNSSDSTLPKVSSDEVKIKILNATKISGLAASYEVDLKQKGYKNIDTGNTDLRSKSVIMVDDKDVKAMLKNDIRGIDDYEKIDDSINADGYDAVIILGSDAKSY